MEQFNFYAVSIRFARAFGLVVTGYRDGWAVYGVAV